MVTRSEAIERMAIGLVLKQVVLGGGSVPSTPTAFDRVEAAAALDALLDYLEEQSFPAELIADLRRKKEESA